MGGRKQPRPPPTYFGQNSWTGGGLGEKAFQAKLSFQEGSDLPVNNGVSVLIISTLRYGDIFLKYFKNI